MIKTQFVLVQNIRLCSYLYSDFNMINTQILPPFQWLTDLERRAKLRASKGLPRPPVLKIWRGIAFRLGQSYLVTPLNEIREIIPYPNQLAKVPGAKPWVKGLANIRGLLLPVIDLNACLEGNPTTINNRSRMLIISQRGIDAGLLVEDVLGIKNFPEQTRDENTSCKEVNLIPFAKGIFTDQEITWTVFNLQALVTNELFLKAAL
jgi:twitching motility protein PilI